MPDYSEFPTTPTAWQEQHLRDWQVVAPLDTEDPPQPERGGVDRTALVAGLVFVALAIVVMAGAVLPLAFFDGGLVWLFLIGTGVALLVTEVRRARRRR